MRAEQYLEVLLNEQYVRTEQCLEVLLKPWILALIP